MWLLVVLSKTLIPFNGGILGETLDTVIEW